MKKYKAIVGFMVLATTVIGYGAMGIGVSNSFAGGESLVNYNSDDSFVCWARSVDDGEPKVVDCGASIPSQYYGVYDDGFPIVVKGISLYDFFWSNLHLSKFLASEELNAYIDAQNNNIDLYLGAASGKWKDSGDWRANLDYSENDPYIVGIKNFVATLPNGRVTTADELFVGFRVLQLEPFGIATPISLSEAQEHFNILIP